MKYLLIQLFLLICSVTFLYYFNTIPGFTPTDTSGEVDWTKVAFVLFFIFLFIQSVVALFIYIVEKLVAYGKKEFPPKRLSLKWGIGTSLGFLAVLFLHINHLVTLGWGFVIFAGYLIILFLI